MLMKKTIDMNALGKRLKLARVARDFTIQQLSALSGVGINQISRLENSDVTALRSAPRLQQALQATKPPTKRPRPRKAMPVG
jgi:transcriptional regulator with XRE-family HTH domain